MEEDKDKPIKQIKREWDDKELFLKQKTYDSERNVLKQNTYDSERSLEFVSRGNSFIAEGPMEQVEIERSLMREGLKSTQYLSKSEIADELKNQNDINQNNNQLFDKFLDQLKQKLDSSDMGTPFQTYESHYKRLNSRMSIDSHNTSRSDINPWGTTQDMVNTSQECFVSQMFTTLENLIEDENSDMLQKLKNCVAILLQDYLIKIEQLDMSYVGSVEQGEIQKTKLNNLIREVRNMKISLKLADDKYEHLSKLFDSHKKVQENKFNKLKIRYYDLVSQKGGFNNLKKNSGGVVTSSGTNRIKNLNELNDINAQQLQVQDLESQNKEFFAEKGKYEAVLTVLQERQALNLDLNEKLDQKDSQIKDITQKFTKKCLEFETFREETEQRVRALHPIESVNFIKQFNEAPEFTSPILTKDFSIQTPDSMVFYYSPDQQESTDKPDQMIIYLPGRNGPVRYLKEIMTGPYAKPQTYQDIIGGSGENNKGELNFIIRYPTQDLLDIEQGSSPTKTISQNISNQSNDQVKNNIVQYMCGYGPGGKPGLSATQSKDKHHMACPFCAMLGEDKKEPVLKLEILPDRNVDNEKERYGGNQGSPPLNRDGKNYYDKVSPRQVAKDLEQEQVNAAGNQQKGLAYESPQSSNKDSQKDNTEAKGTENDRKKINDYFASWRDNKPHCEYKLYFQGGIKDVCDYGTQLGEIGETYDEVDLVKNLSVRNQPFSPFETTLVDIQETPIAEGSFFKKNIDSSNEISSHKVSFTKAQGDFRKISDEVKILGKDQSGKVPIIANEHSQVGMNKMNREDKEKMLRAAKSYQDSPEHREINPNCQNSLKKLNNISKQVDLLDNTGVKTNADENELLSQVKSGKYKLVTKEQLKDINDEIENLSIMVFDYEQKLALLTEESKDFNKQLNLELNEKIKKIALLEIDSEKQKEQSLSGQRNIDDLDVKAIRESKINIPDSGKNHHRTSEHLEDYTVFDKVIDSDHIKDNELQQIWDNAERKKTQRKNQKELKGKETQDRRNALLEKLSTQEMIDKMFNELNKRDRYIDEQDNEIDKIQKKWNQRTVNELVERAKSEIQADYNFNLANLEEDQMKKFVELETSKNTDIAKLEKKIKVIDKEKLKLLKDASRNTDEKVVNREKKIKCLERDKDELLFRNEDLNRIINESQLKRQHESDAKLTKSASGCGEDIDQLNRQLTLLQKENFAYNDTADGLQTKLDKITRELKLANETIKFLEEAVGIAEQKEADHAKEMLEYQQMKEDFVNSPIKLSIGQDNRPRVNRSQVDSWKAEDSPRNKTHRQAGATYIQADRLSSSSHDVSSENKKQVRLPAKRGIIRQKSDRDTNFKNSQVEEVFDSIPDCKAVSPKEDSKGRIPKKISFYEQSDCIAPLENNMDQDQLIDELKYENELLKKKVSNMRYVLSLLSWEKQSRIVGSNVVEESPTVKNLFLKFRSECDESTNSQHNKAFDPKFESLNMENLANEGAKNMQKLVEKTKSGQLSGGIADSDLDKDLENYINESNVIDAFNNRAITEQDEELTDNRTSINNGDITDRQNTKDLNKQFGLEEYIDAIGDLDPKKSNSYSSKKTLDHFTTYEEKMENPIDQNLGTHFVNLSKNLSREDNSKMNEIEAALNKELDERFPLTKDAHKKYSYMTQGSNVSDNADILDRLNTLFVTNSDLSKSLQNMVCKFEFLNSKFLELLKTFSDLKYWNSAGEHADLQSRLESATTNFEKFVSSRNTKNNNQLANEMVYGNSISILQEITNHMDNILSNDSMKDSKLTCKSNQPAEDEKLANLKKLLLMNTKYTESLIEQCFSKKLTDEAEVEVKMKQMELSYSNILNL